MRVTSSVFFFNEKQELLKIVSKKKLFKNTQTKEITADKKELINDKLEVDTLFDDTLVDARFMAVKETDKDFSLYEIQSSTDPKNTLSFVGINFAIKELHGYIVKDIRPKDSSIKTVATRLLEATDGEWRVDYVKPNLPSITDSFYYQSVKDCLKQLQSHGCEIIFKIKITNNKITDKYIEIYDKIGTASNKRFTYGGSALTVVKEVDRSQITTSLIGRGKGEEVGDGYGRRIEFTDVEWKKSSGKPINKPKGQNWIELPDMTAAYGIPLKSGKMRKREGVLVLDDIEDKEKLLLNTYNALIEISRPLVQFKTDVFSGDAIGNTIPVHRYDRGYHYRARIFKVVIDRLTGKVSSEVGDNLAKKSAIKTSSDIKLDLDRIDEEKVAFYSAEEIAKWQSDIIRGSKGGSFIMMNEADLGISDDRTPFQTVWMNGESLEISDHFLVANSEGIGFISGDFNMDNFHSAWTIDGVFNARFIQTGILAGPNFHLDLDTGVAEFAKGKLTGPGLEINMTSGNVKFKKGRMESANGKSYIDLNTNDFRLDNGDSVRLSPNEIGLYNGSEKVSQLDRNGIGIFRNSKPIGFIGTNSKKGNSNVKGLVFDLEYGEGDYMTMAYRENSSSDSYTAMFTVDPKGQFFSKKGIYASLDLYALEGTYTNSLGTSNKSQKIDLLNFSISGHGSGLGMMNGNAGIVITNNDVYIRTSGGLYSWNEWVVNRPT